MPRPRLKHPNRCRGGTATIVSNCDCRKHRGMTDLGNVCSGDRASSYRALTRLWRAAAPTMATCPGILQSGAPRDVAPGAVCYNSLGEATPHTQRDDRFNIDRQASVSMRRREVMNDSARDGLPTRINSSPREPGTPMPEIGS